MKAWILGHMRLLREEEDSSEWMVITFFRFFLTNTSPPGVFP